MPAFLITWRPAGEIEGRGWPESNIRRLVKKLTEKGTVTEPWTFRSYRQAKEGNRVFLVRQGQQGHALFGYGRIINIPEPYEGSVDVAFEALRVPSVDVLATKDELHKITKDRMVWGARSSGDPLRPKVAAALERLVVGRKPINAATVARSDWSQREIDLVVKDYFAMLKKEAKGILYSKTEHRKALRRELPARSNGSIEFKHQNISAVLSETGLPYISGYKPRFNFQRELETAIRKYVRAKPGQLRATLSDFSRPPRRTPKIGRTTELFVAPPRVPVPGSDQIGEKAAIGGRKANFAKRDAANKELGKAGEQFVCDVEKKRLREVGRADLAKKVDWIAKTKGDGYGYDVLSFDERTESERCIEVKTTNSGAETPFYLTSNEVNFGRRNSKRFCIYRLFTFKSNARIFVLRGSPERTLVLRPTEFRAWVRSKH